MVSAEDGPHPLHRVAGPVGGAREDGREFPFPRAGERDVEGEVDRHAGGADVLLRIGPPAVRVEGALDVHLDGVGDGPHLLRDLRKPGRERVVPRGVRLPLVQPQGGRGDIEVDVAEHRLGTEFEPVAAGNRVFRRSEVGAEPLGPDVGESERHLVDDEFDHRGRRVEGVERAGFEDVEFGLVVGDDAEEPRERLLAALEKVAGAQSPVAERAQEKGAQLVSCDLGHGLRFAVRCGWRPVRA